MTNKWLSRFARSRGFLWGSTGISSQKEHYYNYSDICHFFGNWRNFIVGLEKNKIEF